MVIFCGFRHPSQKAVHIIYRICVGAIRRHSAPFWIVSTSSACPSPLEFGKDNWLPTQLSPEDRCLHTRTMDQLSTPRSSSPRVVLLSHRAYSSQTGEMNMPERKPHLISASRQAGLAQRCCHVGRVKGWWEQRQLETGKQIHRIICYSASGPAPARRPGASPREGKADDASQSYFFTLADLQAGSAEQRLTQRFHLRAGTTASFGLP